MGHYTQHLAFNQRQEFLIDSTYHVFYSDHTIFIMMILIKTRLTFLQDYDKNARARGHLCENVRFS